MVIGIRRAAFSNEAGIGSAPIAHAAARTDEPVSEGIVALLEPFIDTVVICTMTGLVIVVTGAYNDPACADFVKDDNGAGLTAVAFGQRDFLVPLRSGPGRRPVCLLDVDFLVLLRRTLLVAPVRPANVDYLQVHLHRSSSFSGSIVTATNLLDVFRPDDPLDGLPEHRRRGIIERQGPPTPRRLLAPLQGGRVGADRERNERNTPMKWLPRNTVVVPIDFSEDAMAAFHTAHELVKDPAHLHAIHVLPLLEVTDPGVIWETIDDESRANTPKLPCATRSPSWGPKTKSTLRSASATRATRSSPTPKRSTPAWSSSPPTACPASAVSCSARSPSASSAWPIAPCWC